MSTCMYLARLNDKGYKKRKGERTRSKGQEDSMTKNRAEVWNSGREGAIRSGQTETQR